MLDLMAGLVSGVARGLVGVVTKPLGGAAELVAQTGQGLLYGTGWCSETIHRSTALPEPVYAIPSSELKYVWKIQTAQQSSTDILLTADVTKITTSMSLKIDGEKDQRVVLEGNDDKHYGENHEIKREHMAAATLLLTREMVHIISVEEDVQESAYILEEIEIVEDEERDPTRFVLIQRSVNN